MNTFFNSVKNFFESVFRSSEKNVIVSQVEDEYDGWLGV
jgi:hypothetical protein